MNKRSLIILVALVVVVAGSILAVAFTMQRTSASASCTTKGASHVVVIQNSTLSTNHLDAQQCDTLTITNRDPETREIGFGAHEHHTAYDGVTEKLLRKDDSFTVTLSQKGTHYFHDHFHDEVAGSFTVR